MKEGQSVEEALAERQGQQGGATQQDPPAGTEHEGGDQGAAGAAGAAQEKEAPTWDYVRELREENARRRTELREFEDAFQAYQPEQRAVLLDIARQLADPTLQPEAAKRLQTIAAAILEDDDGTEPGKTRTPKTPLGEEDPDQRPMTRAEWKIEQARIREEEANERAIAQIEDEARQLGYEPGTDDYFFLLQKAQLPDVAGDLKKAAEKVEDHYRERASQRAREVQDRASRWPGAPGTAADAASEVAKGRELKTFRDAAAATAALFQGRAGQT